jgi:hypothetical protein
MAERRTRWADWTLRAYYDGGHDWAIDDRLEKLVGKRKDGSGAAMSGKQTRDLEWNFRDEAAARKAQKRIDNIAVRSSSGRTRTIRTRLQFKGEQANPIGYDPLFPLEGLSGAQVAIIAGGVLAVVVVGYLIYKNVQPASAATTQLSVTQQGLSLPPSGQQTTPPNVPAPAVTECMFPPC